MYRRVGSIYGYGKGGQRIEGTELKVLEKPIPMAYLSKGNKRYYRVSMKVKDKRLSVYEHILIYAIHHGIDSLRNDLHIDHIDGNKHNNKIDNLELVTVEENNRRILELDLLCPRYGEDNGSSKLSDSDVLEIRDLYGKGEHNQYDLAKMFDVTQGHISEIVNRKRWTHI